MLVCSIDVGRENFAYAFVETAAPWQLVKWGTLNLGDAKATWKRACKVLFAALDASLLSDMKRCKKIYVEQQQRAAFFNTQISTCLWAYCQCRGLPEVQSVSPQKKFRHAKVRTYAERKRASVAWVLANREGHISDELFSEWDSRGKKDDMADALMQAVVC